MFKNALIFLINDDWVQPETSVLEAALASKKFVECGASERESFGWSEPRGEKHGPLVESVGGHLILKMMGETKMLPASVIKEEVEKLCIKIKEERGMARIGTAMKKELKEKVEFELLPKAFTKKGATSLWVNPVGKFIIVDAGSLKKADRLIEELIKAMAEAGSEMKVRPVNTATSPSVAMSIWLTEQEPPAGFSVDRECELKSTDGEKATVRYSKHTLDIQEVVDHIKQGKVPTKLAMTCDSRVSFVLTDELNLKKIDILDVVMKESDSADGGFDANVAIMTGELSKLVPALIDVLGGEQVLGMAHTTATDGVNKDQIDAADAPGISAVAVDSVDAEGATGADSANAPWDVAVAA